jgi:ankyrin repeat protein
MDYSIRLGLKLSLDDSSNPQYLLHECKTACRSSIILQYIDSHPEALLVADRCSHLPFHFYLGNKNSTAELALLMIEKYPAALQQSNDKGELPLHIECSNICRSTIVSTCIEIYPEALAKASNRGDLPLHSILRRKSATVEQALMMLEKYQAAMYHKNKHSYLPLHIECMCQCRSVIIDKCIEVYEAILTADSVGNLPFHILASNFSSTVDQIIMVIDNYPAIVQLQVGQGFLPIHLECMRQCRIPIISKLIEVYPESLAQANFYGYLPFLYLFDNNSWSTTDVMALVYGEYPAAIKHRNRNDCSPLLMECKYQCRPSFISKLIELYPEALADADRDGYLPLHWVLFKLTSPSDLALMMIEKYPAALNCQTIHGDLPIHLECGRQCRAIVILKCVSINPESLDSKLIDSIMNKVHNDNFVDLLPILVGIHFLSHELLRIL